MKKMKREERMKRRRRRREEEDDDDEIRKQSRTRAGSEWISQPTGPNSELYTTVDSVLG